MPSNNVPSQGLKDSTSIESSIDESPITELAETLTVTGISRKPAALANQQMDLTKQTHTANQTLRNSLSVDRKADRAGTEDEPRIDEENYAASVFKIPGGGHLQYLLVISLDDKATELYRRAESIQVSFKDEEEDTPWPGVVISREPWLSPSMVMATIDRPERPEWELMARDAIAEDENWVTLPSSQVEILLDIPVLFGETIEQIQQQIASTPMRRVQIRKFRPRQLTKNVQKSLGNLTALHRANDRIQGNWRAASTTLERSSPDFRRVVWARRLFGRSSTPRSYTDLLENFGLGTLPTVPSHPEPLHTNLQKVFHYLRRMPEGVGIISGPDSDTDRVLSQSIGQLLRTEKNIKIGLFSKTVAGADAWADCLNVALSDYQGSNKPKILHLSSITHEKAMVKAIAAHLRACLARGGTEFCCGQLSTAISFDIIDEWSSYQEIKKHMMPPPDDDMIPCFEPATVAVGKRLDLDKISADLGIDETSPIFGLLQVINKYHGGDRSLQNTPTRVLEYTIASLVMEAILPDGICSLHMVGSFAQCFLKLVLRGDGLDMETEKDLWDAFKRMRTKAIQMADFIITTVANCGADEDCCRFKPDLIVAIEAGRTTVGEFSILADRFAPEYTILAGDIEGTKPFAQPKRSMKIEEMSIQQHLQQNLRWPSLKVPL